MSDPAYDEPRRFVIRDARFGLCIREAETAAGALLAFVADSLAADGKIAADTVETNEHGVASVWCRGERYEARAVPS
jgi:hypothetical protein